MWGMYKICYIIIMGGWVVKNKVEDTIFEGLIESITYFFQGAGGRGVGGWK